MNETIKNIITRRSTRKFKTEQIEQEKLDLILKAGEYAASGMGKQSPIMLVIQDKETKELFRKMNLKAMGKDKNSEFDPFYGAPTIIVVLSNVNMPTHIEDGALVIGNLMLAAHSLGIGSCWIHRAFEEFKNEAEAKDILRKLGYNPDEYVGVGHCILGYSDEEEKEATPRKADYIHYI